MKSRHKLHVADAERRETRDQVTASVRVFKPIAERGNAKPKQIKTALTSLKIWHVCFFFCCRVPPDLKSSVYHFGIVTGGEKEWDFAYNQFKSTDVVSDKLILLQAMAGSQEPWIIERQETVILRVILIDFQFSWSIYKTNSSLKSWWLFHSCLFINSLKCV